MEKNNSNIELNKPKYTNEMLKEMQSWDLERKIQVTKTRIMEFYNHFPDKIYISFSGGKDSTVLLHLVRSIYPNTPAVFVDTGLEYPELREFVKTIDNVTWLKPEMNFRKVIETYGYPIISKSVSRAVHDVKKLGNNCWFARSFDGRETKFYNYQKYKYLLDAPFNISNKCCDIMKKKPLKKYEKQTGNYPIIGIMTSESLSRRNAWLSHGCNAFNAVHPSSQPLSFWTEQDILRYLKEFNIPYASVYGDIVKDKNSKYSTTGLDRTGCVFCGFGCHLDKEPNRFQRLKETHPKLWDYCMKPWDKGGLGMKEVLDYINVKTE